MTIEQGFKMLDTLINELSDNYLYAYEGDYRKINRIKMPVNQIIPNEITTEAMNRYIDMCEQLADNRIISKIKYTQSGGFKTGTKAQMYAYAVVQYKFSLKLYVFAYTKCWCLEYAFRKTENTNTETISGFKAFNIFKKKCLEFGINLNDYANNDIISAKQIAEEVVFPARKMLYNNLCGINKDWNDMWHLDIHSAFPYALTQVYPEFKPVIEYLYSMRKTNPIYKSVLNMSIGYMYSSLCCYKWSHIAKAALDWHNAYMDKLYKIVALNGSLAMSFNVDGIWFRSLTQELYDALKPYLGKDLGNVELDYQDVTVNFKSAGSYQIKFDDGSVETKVQGVTAIDAIKNRNEWSWHEIYQYDCVRHFIYDSDEHKIYYYGGN